MYNTVRYQGKWYKITPKKFEPEKQTFTIAWMMIKDSSLNPEEAYRQFYKIQREDNKVLYPSFRKEENGN